MFVELNMSALSTCVNQPQAHGAKPTVTSQLLQNGVTLKEWAGASPCPDPGWGEWALNTGSPRVVVRALASNISSGKCTCR